VDTRYANREEFARRAGLNPRLVADLENGRRGSYKNSTIQAVEQAYRVASGSIAEVIDGGELKPAEPAATPPQEHAEDREIPDWVNQDDPAELQIWGLRDLMPPEQVKLHIDLHRALPRDEPPQGQREPHSDTPGKSTG
jgi:transcriptional regulator with XRE-family HTH domain